MNCITMWNKIKVIKVAERECEEQKMLMAAKGIELILISQRKIIKICESVCMSYSWWMNEC